jgi:1-deoxy-D-xylulose-5-phosphate synthase
MFRDAECDVPLRDLAVPQVFHDLGSRDEVLGRIGLTAQDVARRVTEWASRLGSASEPASEKKDANRS